jgi:hypothetical protein
MHNYMCTELQYDALFLTDSYGHVVSIWLSRKHLKDVKSGLTLEVLPR